MANRPFRFVHAADFHLETPPGGISEVPDHLRDMLIESTFSSAERVFDTVLAEEADFLVLAGDILDAQLTGPRGPAFLVQQFQRLAERGIGVYWAGGRVDPPEAWPTTVKRPDNVHVFPHGRPESFQAQRDGLPLARVLGAARVRGRALRAKDFEPDAGGLFTIVAVHGKADAAALESRGIHYWALGGNHTRQTLFGPPHAPHTAHYPGTLQGRRPNETGPHGCTLVSVDEQQQVRTTLLPTDRFRWHDERIELAEPSNRTDLEARLRDRLHALADAEPAMDLLVCWTIVGGGPLAAAIRHGGLGADLLNMLRNESRTAKLSVWNATLAAEPLAVLPTAWYEQETILGDFLRQVRHYQMNSQESLELEACLSEAQTAGTLGSMVSISDPTTRERVLREAAMLGVDLLSGEGTPQ